MKIFTSSTRLSKGACALAVAGAVALPLAPVLAENINIAAQNVAAQNVAAGDQATAGASFGWGVRASFLSYNGMPREMTDGAAWDATAKQFTFTPTSTTVSEDGKQVTLQAAGRLWFTGHCAEGQDPETGCALNLTFSNPRVELNLADGTGSLYMTVRTKNYASGKFEGPMEVKMATLSTGTAKQSEKDGVVSISGISANLTADGNHAFSDFYNEGASLDPLSISYTGSAANAPKSTYSAAESYNTGAGVNQPQNTARLGQNHIVHVAPPSFSGDTTYTVLNSSNLKMTDTGVLKAIKGVFAVDADGNRMLVIGSETNKPELYTVTAEGKLVSSGIYSDAELGANTVKAIGYNPANNTWGILSIDGQGGGKLTIIDASGKATSQALPKPDSIDPQVVNAYSLDEYYGDSFSNNTVTLAPLPDGSFVYAPSTSIYDASGEKVVQKGHLLHLSSNGVSLVPNSSPEGYTTALPSTLVSPKGYIYRWNNWYGGKVQILKYENGTFSVVRESSTLEGFEKTEVATMFLTRAGNVVVVDASGSRLVFMDDTLNKVNEVVLSSMRKTDKSGGYNALELPNGDIIYPTSFENPNTYEDQLWLNRLAANSAPAPAPEPTKAPEPTMAPEPTKSAEPTVAPTVAPSAEPTVAPTAEPTKSAEPTVAPTAEPTKSAEPTVAPTAEPTVAPSATAEPTMTPSASAEPTAEPSVTAEPTATAEPTVAPTEAPSATAEPSVTAEPTAVPSEEPTSPSLPTASVAPSVAPSASATPSASASVSPTAVPSVPAVTPSATVSASASASASASSSVSASASSSASSSSSASVSASASESASSSASASASASASESNTADQNTAGHKGGSNGGSDAGSDASDNLGVSGSNGGSSNGGSSLGGGSSAGSSSTSGSSSSKLAQTGASGAMFAAAAGAITLAAGTALVVARRRKS
ncbi:HtaA domain-containing protein [Rothia mucilaginosa]|uniref:HtaA domain-containing protein n=1 Tax=Rothia mucilaginosa TaxID=43675 RepID=UPI002889B89D|nr:HtaA domain-containing protein [Rothia mucilaginosa]